MSAAVDLHHNTHRTISLPQTAPAVALSALLQPLDNGMIKVGNTYTPTYQLSLDPQEHLYLEGDRQQQVYRVVDGVIGSYCLLPDGRRQIDRFFYPGDLIGFGYPEHFTTHAVALCTTRVQCIPTHCIDTLFQAETTFQQAMLQHITTELNDTRAQLLSLGRKSALEKVATFLQRIHTRTHLANNQQQSRDQPCSRHHTTPDGRSLMSIRVATQPVYLPMSRADIADYLGLTVETISRCLRKLKTSGVITLKSHSLVEILCPTMLEAIADGDHPISA